MLAERANESFDSLARLIHDTGVACNLPAYPTDSTWTFTYEPYTIHQLDSKVEQEVPGKNPTFRRITISPFGSA